MEHLSLSTQLRSGSKKDFIKGEDWYTSGEDFTETSSQSPSQPKELSLFSGLVLGSREKRSTVCQDSRPNSLIPNSRKTSRHSIFKSVPAEEDQEEEEDRDKEEDLGEEEDRDEEEDLGEGEDLEEHLGEDSEADRGGRGFGGRSG